MDPEEIQENTGRGYDNNEGLGGNLVQENNAQFEGEQEFDQYNQDPNQMAQNENQNVSEVIIVSTLIELLMIFQEMKNSLKKRKLKSTCGQIFTRKAGYSLSTCTGYIFTINKILLLTTFTEFLFQRFDVVTLFLCIAVIFIELEIFSHKHLYKWLLVLISSFLLDAFVLLDISPVSKYYLNFYFLYY